MTDLSDEERRQTLQWLEQRRTFGGKILFFQPYPKQREFLDMGAHTRERLLIAGNQNGKTITGAYEAALHATGDYPGDWRGRVFRKPTRGWVCGETSVAVRDIQQAKLCGPAGVDALYGSGMVPKDRLIDRSMARGVTDSYDTVQIRHKSGGISTITFKSYEQGRAKFQGESLDWLWFDEEPPEDVYAEGLTRTAATKGIAWTTFTPLKGRSNVVMRFLEDPNDDRGTVMMTIDYAQHIPQAEKERIIAGYLPHEREARARGIPMIGSGRIFQTPEESLAEPPLEYIPSHWTKIWGIDFGINHPFAAVLLIWDRDNDVIHVHHTVRIADALPIMHAAAMRPIGAAVPLAGRKTANSAGKPSADPSKTSTNATNSPCCPANPPCPAAASPPRLERGRGGKRGRFWGLAV